jgi:YegS/Rv2252/BmrU family lipid kinase
MNSADFFSSKELNLMKTAIIVNRLKIKAVAPLLEPIKKKHPEIALFYTEQKGDGFRLAQSAIEQSYHKLISVGGDGTHSEVVNAVMGFDGDVRERIAIGFFPAGTGNDFCRMIQICPIEELCHISTFQKIDLLQTDYRDAQGNRKTRICLNIAEFGVLAEVVKTYNVNFASSRKSGKGPYIKSFLGVLKKLTCSRINMKLGDESETMAMANIVIANGSFFGSGIGIAPGARVNDGKFDVTVLKATGRLHLALTLAKALCGRKFAEPTAFRKATTLQAKPVDPQENIPFEIDGEWLGYLPIKIKVLPQAISILNPIARK